MLSRRNLIALPNLPIDRNSDGTDVSRSFNRQNSRHTPPHTIVLAYTHCKAKLLRYRDVIITYSSQGKNSPPQVKNIAVTPIL